MTRPVAARTRDERGGVAALVALLILPIMVITAFTLDIGMAYAQAQAFASGADSAALAIVDTKRKDLNANPSVPKTCAQIVAADGTQSSTIATSMANKNGPFNLSTSDGIQVTATLRCVDSAGNNDPTGNLRADVTVKRSVPTTLGKLVGVTTMQASRQSSAGLGVEGDVASAFPMVICDAQAQDIVAKATTKPYPLTVIDVDKVWKADCSSKNGSGNWGWLDCGGNGTPILADAIRNGCDIDTTLTGTPPTITLDGTPGNKINAGQVRDAMDDIKGGVFPFPVFDLVNGKGANTEYRVVGFINLEFVDYDKSGSITVRYVSYSPVGSLNTSCGIGKVGCTAYNAWTTRLSR